MLPAFRRPQWTYLNINKRYKQTQAVWKKWCKTCGFRCGLRSVWMTMRQDAGKLFWCGIKDERCMMPVQINKHHCMARKGRLKGFQTAYGLFCNLKPMRAQCMRIMLLWVACLPTQLHNGHLNRHYQHGMQRPSENLSDGLCYIVKCKKSDTERHFTTA